MKNKLPIVKMVEEFQCPGCLVGGNTTCGFYDLEELNGGAACKSHVSGTTVIPSGKIYLGMPKGFNKVGTLSPDRNNNIRLWTHGTAPVWNSLNVAVWAMEHKKHLFVRTFSPRISLSFLDIVQDGTLALVPNAIDVSKFIDDID